MHLHISFCFCFFAPATNSTPHKSFRSFRRIQAQQRLLSSLILSWIQLQSTHHLSSRCKYQQSDRILSSINCHLQQLFFFTSTNFSLFAAVSDHPFLNLDPTIASQTIPSQLFVLPHLQLIFLPLNCLEHEFTDVNVRSYRCGSDLYVRIGIVSQFPSLMI
jgi:hypothetical protein